MRISGIFAAVCANFLIAGAAASCDFPALENQCRKHMTDLWYKTMALNEVVPAIEMDPSVEFEPSTQQVFGAYCRTLSETAACVSGFTESNCDVNQMAAYQHKLKQMIFKVPGASKLKMLHPACEEMLDTLKLLG